MGHMKWCGRDLPNKKYESGRGLEYRIKDKLESQGYFVIRAAGSHGVADLVAVQSFEEWECEEHLVCSEYGHKKINGTEHHKILFISCKIPQYAPPAERKALVETAKKYGAVPMITVKKDGKWELERVTI